MNSENNKNNNNKFHHNKAHEFTKLRSWQSTKQHVAGLTGRRSERPGRAEQSWSGSKKIKLLKTYQNSRNIKNISMIKQWSNIKLFNKLFNYLTMIRFKAWSALLQAFVLIQRPSGQRSAIHRSAASRSLRQRSKSQKSQLPPGWRGTLRTFVMSVNLGHKLLLGVTSPLLW